jgi:hypothetical protein
MSRINLSTSSDIIDFFKILAEESVKQAKEEVSSQDPEQKRLERAMAKDEKTFQTVTEEDNPEEEDEEEEAVEDAEVQSVEDVPSKEAETADTPSDKSAFDAGGADLGIVIDAIQKMRGSRSIKDSAVSAPLKKWFYGELDEPQRRALSAFAEALNDIMYRQQDTTVDPGDAPWNVAMSIKAKKDEEEEQSGEEEVEDITVSSATEKTPEESEEDTSPPIKVGEQQNISEIRQKVQELLRAD